MNSAHTDAIFEIIMQSPGIGAAEIARQVGCDIRVIDRSIRADIKAGMILQQIVKVPGKRSTCVFRTRTPA